MSYERALALVKERGMALMFIKSQTPEICIEAVKQNGFALECVKEQTPEICLEAIKKEGYALYGVKDLNALKDYLRGHKEILPLLLNYNEQLTGLVKEILSE